MADCNKQLILTFVNNILSSNLNNNLNYLICFGKITLVTFLEYFIIQSNFIKLDKKIKISVKKITEYGN